MDWGVKPKNKIHSPKRLSDSFISCLTEGTFYKKDYGKKFKYPKKLVIDH